MEAAMTDSIRPRRRRIERGIYEEPNGKYAVCVMVAAKPRFRTIDAETLTEARRQRALLQMLGELGELPLSPRLTFGAIAARWVVRDCRVRDGWQQREREPDAGLRRDADTDPDQRSCRLRLSDDPHDQLTQQRLRGRA
jgi:hypothetical protein